MHRRHVLLAVVAVVLPGVAWADASDIEARIVRSLRAQGYDRIRVAKTWLGRRRVVASGAAGRREIIFNPRTGEILRDLWSDPDADTSLIDRDDKDRSVTDDAGGDDPSDDGGTDDGGDDGGTDDGGDSDSGDDRDDGDDKEDDKDDSKDDGDNGDDD